MTRAFERLRRTVLETFVAVIIAILGGIAFGGLDRLFDRDETSSVAAVTASNVITYIGDR